MLRPVSSDRPPDPSRARRSRSACPAPPEARSFGARCDVLSVDRSVVAASSGEHSVRARCAAGYASSAAETSDVSVRAWFPPTLTASTRIRPLVP
ncbi:hypothetical protein GCM10010519_25340 [Streptomyces lactacystinicus]